MLLCHFHCNSVKALKDKLKEHDTLQLHMHTSHTAPKLLSAYVDRHTTLFVISTRLSHQLRNVLFQVINTMSHVI